MNEIQPMDWSATAAWIALVISVTGTFLGPIVTTILTNRHQLKLRKLDIEEKQADSLNTARITAIENFVCYVGQCIVNPTHEHKALCGKYFFQVYAYVPRSLWDSLDDLYVQINERNWDVAKTSFNEIAKPLVLILKDIHQESP